MMRSLRLFSQKQKQQENSFTDLDSQIGVLRAAFESKLESFSWGDCQKSLDEITINRFLNDENGIFLLNIWALKHQPEFKRWILGTSSEQQIISHRCFSSISAVFVTQGLVSKEKVTKFYNALIMGNNFFKHVECPKEYWRIFVQFPAAFLCLGYLCGGEGVLESMLESISYFIEEDGDRRQKQIAAAFLFQSTESSPCLLAYLKQSSKGGDLILSLVQKVPQFFTDESFKKKTMQALFYNVKFSKMEADSYLKAVLRYVEHVDQSLYKEIPLTKDLIDKLRIYVVEADYRDLVFKFFVNAMSCDLVQNIGVWWYQYSLLFKDKVIPKSLFGAIQLLCRIKKVDVAFCDIHISFWPQVYKGIKSSHGFAAVWCEFIAMKIGRNSIFDKLICCNREFVLEMFQSTRPKLIPTPIKKTEEYSDDDLYLQLRMAQKR